MNFDCGLYIVSDWISKPIVSRPSSSSFTCEFILNFHMISIEFVTLISLFVLMLSLSPLSVRSWSWTGFNFSKEWLCCDVDRWRKMGKPRRENQVVRELKGELCLWEALPPYRTLRIGIQLQMIPAHISVTLQGFRVDGSILGRSRLTTKCKV